MGKVIFIICVGMLSLNLQALDSKPQPFEYFEPNIYANMFDDKSAFVEVPAVFGAIIGDVTGIAAGIPLGIAFGLPVAAVNGSDEPMVTGIYYGWLCLGLPLRISLAQIISSPFFLMKKVFWDLPKYCL